jgi:hypothetical protein
VPRRPTCWVETPGASIIYRSELFRNCRARLIAGRSPSAHDIAGQHLAARLWDIKNPRSSARGVYAAFTDA